MRLIILGAGAAEKIKEHIVKAWDNMEVMVYKSLDLFAGTLENRTVTCDRVIVTEEALSGEDKAGSLQIIKDFLDERFITVQMIVILKSRELLAECTDICYDESSSAVFCVDKMKTNFVRDLPAKSIAELRKVYSAYLYVPAEELPEEHNSGEMYDETAEDDYGGDSEIYADEEYPDDEDEEFQRLSEENGVEVDDYLPGVDEYDTAETDGSASEYDGDNELPEDGLPMDYDLSAIVSSYEEQDSDEKAHGSVQGENVVPRNNTGGVQQQISDGFSPRISDQAGSVRSDGQENARRRGKLFGKGVSERQTAAPSIPDIPVNSVSATKYAQLLNGQLYGFIVVTGDRRAGATTFAMETAAHFAKQTETLYVDFDIDRHGSIYYLSVETLANCGTAVQNGLGALRIGTNVETVAYRPPNRAFDALLSLPGYVLDDESLQQTMLQLMQQREYHIVVIDCPIARLRHLSDILSMASIFICVNGDIGNCAATLFALDELNPMTKPAGATTKNRLSERDIAMLYRSRYVITGDVSEQQFLGTMKFLSSLYGFSSQNINWTTMPIAGKSANISSILQNMA